MTQENILLKRSAGSKLDIIAETLSIYIHQIIY
jgi:hypothetical protein